MGTPRYNSTTNQFERTGNFATYAVDGALTIADGDHLLTKGSAGAYTLAPPSTAQDGIRMTIVSRTAFAHTVTLTEGIGGKGASFDVMTFAAVGDSITLLASNGHWALLASSGVAVA